MWRAVALSALGLLLVACSSTVPGRPGTDRAAPPQTTPDTPTSMSTTEVTSGNGPSTGPPGEWTPGEPTPAEPTRTTGATPTAPGQPATPPTGNGPPAALPAGFYSAGSELGYRPMATDEFECSSDQTSGCFGFLVFSAPGCPTGASVTVGIFDKATDPDNPIGTAAGTTAPIDANGSQAVVIADSTGAPASLTARVQQVVC